jgi:nucleotide-binding universal stress UspA family protein
MNERILVGTDGSKTAARVDADPVSALIDEARDRRADLLVLGNKGMTGLSRFFTLGSVPNKVAHHLPCRLLIVKTT